MALAVPAKVKFLSLAAAICLVRLLFVDDSLLRVGLDDVALGSR